MPVMRSDEWRVHVLRTTVFSPGPPSEYKFRDWAETIGSPPETTNTNPRVGTKEEVGTYNDGLLVYQEQLDRVNWRYVSSMEVRDGEMQLGPGAIAFREVAAWFVPMMKEWIASAPAISRVAFGAELMLPVGSHQEGYQVLDTFLHQVDVDPESRDFEYRINRRRDSTTLDASVEINRLSQWKCKKYGLQIQHDGSTNVINMPEVYMVLVDLDVNSIPEIKEIPTGDPAGDLLQELVHLAEEIAHEGDIK